MLSLQTKKSVLDAARMKNPAVTMQDAFLAQGWVSVNNCWYASPSDAQAETGMRQGYGGLARQWVIDTLCTYPAGRGMRGCAADVVGM